MVSMKSIKYLLIEIAAIMLLVILCTGALLVSAALLIRWLDLVPSYYNPPRGCPVYQEDRR